MIFKKYDKTLRVLLGSLIGMTNGFFGSGGGIVSVQVLEKLGLEQTKSHATSLMIILPLSIVSAVIYFLSGSVSFNIDTWLLLGGASVGGIIGAFMLGKLKADWVNIVFTILIIASGIRMVF